MQVELEASCMQWFAVGLTCPMVLVWLAGSWLIQESSTKKL